MGFTYFFIAFIILMIGQRLIEIFKKREKQKGLIKAQWTFFVLLFFHIAVVASTILEYFLKVRKISIPVSLLGFFLFLIGVIGRNWSIKSLGLYHSMQIEIRRGQKMVREGPYRYMRNPYYLSVIFEIIAFPIIANAVLSFFFALFSYVPVMLIRVFMEERYMEKDLGDEYLKYKKEVFRFLPMKRFC